MWARWPGRCSDKDGSGASRCCAEDYSSLEKDLHLRALGAAPKKIQPRAAVLRQPSTWSGSDMAVRGEPCRPALAVGSP